ncbi:MAG: hypothetical protein ABIO70_36480 [Pseudomonadota bacterium]
MPKRRRWPLILLVLVLLGGLATCCGCAGLWHFFPDILIAAFTENQPLTAPTVASDPLVEDRLEQRFAAGGPVVISAEELMQLVDPQGEEQIDAFWLEIHPDDSVEVTLSVRLDDEDLWFNVHGVGSFELEHGWFTHMAIDDLVAGGWDLGQYMTRQELAQQANQSLANQRAQDPDMAAALDEVEHLWVEGGVLYVELAEGGYERFKALRR